MTAREMVGIGMITRLPFCGLPKTLTRSTSKSRAAVSYSWWMNHITPTRMGMITATRSECGRLADEHHDDHDARQDGADRVEPSRQRQPIRAHAASGGPCLPG